jgi:hypothetical protein
MNGKRHSAISLPWAVILVVLILSSCIGKGEQLPLGDPPEVGGPPAVPLPRSFKGYELYSWQVGREWYFTLITGTNRPKRYDELGLGSNTVQEDWVKITVQGTDDLKATLGQLPPGTHVAWMGSVHPPRRVVKQIQAHCQNLGIDLE